MSSTRASLAIAYFGFGVRYLYLLVLVPFYGRVLGPAEYGRLMAASSLFQLVWLALEYGLPTAGERDLAAATEPEEKAKIYFNHVKARLVTLVPALLVGIIGSLGTGVIRERPIFGVLATLAGLFAGCNNGWFFQGILKPRTSVLIETLSLVVGLPIILLTVKGPEDAWYSLAVLVGTGLIANVGSHYLAIRTLGSVKVVTTLKTAFQTLKATTPLFAQRAAAITSAHTTIYIISIYALAEEVGWFGAADRFSVVGFSLMLPANQVLVGRVVRAFSSGGSLDAGFALVRKSLGLMMLASAACVGGVFLLADIVLPFVLGPGFERSVELLEILSFLFPILVFGQVINGYVLIPLRHDGPVSQIATWTTLLGIAVTTVVAQVSGIEGVAWGRVVTALIQTLALVWVLQAKQLLKPMLYRTSSQT